jgi:hypothetical protein
MDASLMFVDEDAGARAASMLHLVVLAQAQSTFQIQKQTFDIIIDAAAAYLTTPID